MSLHSLWERANLWFCGGLFCFYLYVCLKECHLDDVIVGSSWLFHNGLGDYILKMCFIWRRGGSEMWVLNRQGWLHCGKCKEPVDFGATGLSSCIISTKSGPTWVNRTLGLAALLMPLMCLFCVLWVSQLAHREITDQKRHCFCRLQIDLCFNE